MAIAFDAASNGSGTTTATVAHTTAGSNRMLTVVVYINSSQTISTCKYAGVDMVQITSQSYSGGVYTMYAFYLLNPTVGTNNIVASAGGGTPGVAVAAASYKNVLSASALDAQITGGSDAGSSDATSLISTTDNCWDVIFAASTAGVTLSADTGTTSRSIGNGILIGDSNAVIHPAGTYSMSVTKTVGNPLRTVVVSFKPNDYSLVLTETSSSSETLTSLRASTVSLTETMSSADTVGLFTDRWKTESKSSSSWTAETKSL